MANNYELDKDVEIMYISTTSSLLSKEAVKINLNKNYNRKIIDNFEPTINTTWQKRVNENPTIYNALKFRLHSLEENKNDYRLVLNFGETDYKDFIGTNCSLNAAFLQDYGIKYFHDKNACFGNAVGVGAAVITLDNKLVLIRRSKNCSEATGLLDRPGGHAEPEEILNNLKIDHHHQHDYSNNGWIHNIAEEMAKNELFESILKEVRDEVNIPIEKLSEPNLLGITRNTTTFGRPSIEFIIRCQLKYEDVSRLYNEATQKEVDESTELSCLDFRLFCADNKNKNPDIEKLFIDFAPALKGLCSLLKIYNFF